MTTTAQTAAFEPLTTAMRGPVIQPGDDGYDVARAVYNAMIDRLAGGDSPLRRRGRRHHGSPVRGRP